MNKELLFFDPVFKEMIWGGNKMRDVFSYNIPGEKTGECWAVSAHPNGDCVCRSASFKGKTLSELWKEQPGLFGNYSSDRFPLLLKVIDAKDDLSIQVHPDDKYAGEKENGSLGKTECWYILECDEDATLVVGHNAATKEELCDMIDNGKFRELIREVPIKKGDFIQINPGTVHAIKGGVMILEIQQNSDITYRLYDYDRLQNGQPRQLHLEQSKAVITVPQKEGSVKSTSDEDGVYNLVECDYYRVLKINISDKAEYSSDSAFSIVSCIEGAGCVSGIQIKKGDHFIVPSDYGKVVFEGKMTLIVSTPA